MGSTSLNNVDGIIDGDVTATWNIALNGQSTDYWTMSWENVPTINLQPTKVELWIDGVKVDEGAVQLNGPDDLNPIVGAVVDANGTILRYVVKGTEPNVTTGETYVPFNSNTVTVEGTDLAALSTAIGNAQAGDTVKLTGNIDIGANPLAIEKNVILDLNGKTISADNRWGVISLKNGASIKNGNIDVKTNVAAIRAFNVGTIENVTIKAVAKDENKVVTAIAVQNGGYVGTIKNVTITGATQGIEVLKGAKVSLIENANVQAVSNATKEGNALIINAGYVGKAVNSTFNGSVYGVHMMLNGEYNVALALENCDVTGATAGIYAHDEVGISNTTNCSLTLTYDAGTKINGGLKWDFEEECQSVVTLNKP
ncbi:MAG: hypothetical protein J6D43_20090 [Pseudomonas sp.]|nr:hypothetical protein [Pseudomonas sp.]